MNIIEDYTNPETPGAFSSIKTFLKNSGGDYNEYEKEQALPALKAYQLHKPVRHKFERNKYLAGTVDHVWQTDLIDVNNLYNKKYKQAFRYILVCIDVLSKYAWAVPIKNKTASETKRGFEKIFQQNRKPTYLQADNGKEFEGECKRYLKSQNVKLYHTSTHTKFKAGIAERFNRTLKEKMYRMFTHNENKKYIDVLDELVYNYNNTIHRAHNLRPASVNVSNQDIVFEKLYGYKKSTGDDRTLKFKFIEGDYVRVFKEKTNMDKGYTKNWLKKVYVINRKFFRIPPVYELFNLKTAKIENRKFYEQELQKIVLEEFPYDSYEVLEEKNKKILIKRLDNNNRDGSENFEPIWVNKVQFLRDE